MFTLFKVYPRAKFTSNIQLLNDIVCYAQSSGGCLMFKKNTPVSLDAALIEEAYTIGKLRFLANREKGVYNAQVSPRNPYLLDGEGVCGEFAFAKMVDASPAEWARIKHVLPRNVEIDLGDVAYGGLQFDIKVTRYSRGHLLIQKSKLDSPVQGYALFTGIYGQYVFRGVISRERIQRQRSLFRTQKSFGTLWIRQDQLADLPAKAITR